MGMSEKDKQLEAIQKCIDAMSDFANYERWQMLDYLANRYGRTHYALIKEPKETDLG